MRSSKEIRDFYSFCPYFNSSLSSPLYWSAMATFFFDYLQITSCRCPLYTQDLKQFHADRVRKSAVKAKKDLGLNENPQLLKVDPTEGLEEYFQRL